MAAGGDATEIKEHFVLVHGAGHGAWCWFRLLPLLRGHGHRVSCVDLAGAAGSRVDPGTVRSFDEYTAPLVDLLAALTDGEKWHGGWSWFKLRWLLEGSGYRVTCIDLAGGGVDPTDPNTVRTFEQYDKPLLDLISNLPEGEKVILMGHGIGGLSVIHAMHEFVDRVKQAIFVAAAMLPFGLQTDEDKKDGLPSLPENEIESTFGAGADDPPTTVALRLEFQRDRLSQQSPEEMCGPTGVGFLHGKFEILSSMEPFLGGGEMIADVFQDKSTYAEPPSRLSYVIIL
ncbi:hypothetical protein ACQ4PT_064906 [Festuca glaucescens]